ncbi:MAG: AMP-binding protein [Phenylobacterium sp.]|nr:AMP-binding protein [Phenylobacterium sp.]
MNQIRESARLPSSRREKQHLVLSPNEERYVLAETLTPHIYILPFTYRIRGRLDVAKLEEALQYVCDRHETMRQGFEPGADGRFEKYVEAAGDASLLYVDMAGAGADEVQSLIHERLFRKPDLTPCSLHTFVLVRTGEDEHVLSISHHHSTSDGQSMRLFTRELFDRYSGVEVSATPVDFSALWEGDWRNSERYEAASAFWRNCLKDVEELVPLPEDRPSGGSSEELSVRLTLPPELIEATDAAAKALGVSQFTFFYAVCVVFLARLTGEKLLCTAFQSNGRRLFDDAVNVTGAFSNALVLATPLEEQRPFADLARRLKVDIRAAIDNEICPYHHVIQDSGLHPRFGINWYPLLPKLVAEGLNVSDADLSDRQSDYDLNIRFVRGVDSFEVILFHHLGTSPERVLDGGRRLLELAGAFARDPDRPIADVQSRDFDSQGVLPDVAASLPVAAGGVLHARFLEAAKRTPEAIALVQAGGATTYGQLEERSLVLARKLWRAGVRPGDRVGIVAERTSSLVWSMLAASRLGATFLVLDSGYPEDRLQTLVGIARPKALLHVEGLDELALNLARPDDLIVLGADVSHDRAGPAVDGESDWLDRADPEAPAYYLITSGSTGTPKCVAVSHQPVPHFVEWQARTFELDARDRFTMLSGLAHDPLMRDIFTPLSLGATLLIPEQSAISEPGELPLWFARERPTVAHLTPSMGRLLTAQGKKPVRLGDLRLCFWGGELLAPGLIEAVRKVAPSAEHVNFYGSTETPQAASYFRCGEDLDWKYAPVGTGSDGFQVFVVDADRRQVGVGELGEIAVRSNYLSLGYVRDGRVLAPDDRGEDVFGRRNIYFTGDRGFHMPDGRVVLLGRQDDQIKVRGYRVDLSEVTAALCGLAGVREGVALADGPEGDRRIRAFVVDERAGADGAGELMAQLRRKLPSYMVPAALERLDRLPRLPNGKIDRKALEARPQVAAVETARPKMSAAESELAAAWSSVLGRRDIGPSASFADIGGDSLSYVQVYLATEEIVGVVPDGWQFMSIRQIAASKRKAKAFLGVVDTSMLVRAISIFLVVCGHFHVFTYNGGATTALFLVSGFMFGGLQLTETLQRNSAKPVLSLFLRLLVPVALFSYALFALKFAVGKGPNLSVLLFYGNFADYAVLEAPYRDGHEMYLWYIHCALQMFVMMYLALLAMKAVGAFAWGRFKVAMALFAFACLLRFVLPGLVDPDFFVNGAQPMATVNHLPTTHWATFLLGATIASVATKTERATIFIATLIYTALSYVFFSTSSWAFLGVFGLMLLFMSRVYVPKLVSRLVLMLSGGSLFIYLTHFQFRSVFEAVGVPEWPLLYAVGAIGGGLVVWMTWQRISVAVTRFFGMRRSVDAEPDAVI